MAFLILVLRGTLSMTTTHHYVPVACQTASFIRFSLKYHIEGMKRRSNGMVLDWRKEWVIVGVIIHMARKEWVIGGVITHMARKEWVIAWVIIHMAHVAIRKSSLLTHER
mmetsp:Transcript_116874/g.203382  ORF Transcript_116874/g.203382 Transcript_116874/m.203382 type:complete len:110 (-) Transcript_116874:133-462(-)